MTLAAITSVNRNTSTILFLVAAIVFFLAFVHRFRPVAGESAHWGLILAGFVIVAIGLMFT